MLNNSKEKLLGKIDQYNKANELPIITLDSICHRIEIDYFLRHDRRILTETACKNEMAEQQH